MYCNIANLHFSWKINLQFPPNFFILVTSTVFNDVEVSEASCPVGTRIMWLDLKADSFPLVSE